MQQLGKYPPKNQTYLVVITPLLTDMNSQTVHLSQKIREEKTATMVMVTRVMATMVMVTMAMVTKQ